MKASHGKKILAMVLVLVFVVLSAACAKEDASSFTPSGTSAENQPTQSEETGLAPLPLATDVNALTGLARPEGMLPGQRPVAIMVMNNQRALPQRGLAAADVIYESLTEGGITRLMAMYADSGAVPQVGPVRSTRDAFVQMALPSDAILVHIGANVYADNLLNILEYQDINGYYLGTTAFVFDTARSLPKPGGKLNEYCWFTDAGLIGAGMESVGMSPTGEVPVLFNFAKEAPKGSEQAYEVNVTYSSVSAAGFNYDPATGLYTKTVFGATHADEDGTPLTFTNLVLLTCPISLKSDGQCTEIDFTGGKGYYITNGAVQSITWRKGEPNEQLRLFDASGAELEVQPGKSYIGFVPDDVQDAIAYRSKTQIEQAAASAPPA